MSLSFLRVYILEGKSSLRSRPHDINSQELNYVQGGGA